LEPLGAEWALRDYGDVEGPARRDNAVHGWITTLARDPGISGHASDIDRFEVYESRLQQHVLKTIPSAGNVTFSSAARESCFLLSSSGSFTRTRRGLAGFD
jgi:hypothetical protein